MPSRASSEALEAAPERGVFRSIQVAINRFLDETNDNPKPFTWTADPDKIIAAVKRGHRIRSTSSKNTARSLKYPP